MRSVRAVAVAVILAATAAPVQGLAGDEVEDLLASLAPSLVVPGNPWWNPGFEATTPDGIAPPATLAREDGLPPASTLALAPALGVTGNALALAWDPADGSVLLRERVSLEGGPHAWIGAGSVSLSVSPDAEVLLSAVVEHASGVAESDAVAVAPGAWTRLTLPVDVPAGVRIDAVAIRVSGADAATVLVDDVAVEGSEFAGATDVEVDGHAVIATPVDGAGAPRVGELRHTPTGIGDRYLVEGYLMDYSTGTPLRVSGVSLDDSGGGIYSPTTAATGPGSSGAALDPPRAVNVVDPARVVFAIARDAALASGGDTAVVYVEIAAPGGAKSGFHAQGKDSLANFAVTDAFDGAFTPLALLDATDGIRADRPLAVAIVEPTGGGFDVRVQTPASGWAESTTLRVTGHPDRVIAIDGLGTTVIEHYAGSSSGVAAEAAGTIFATGDRTTADRPVPVIAAAPSPVLSLENVAFDGSGSLDPLGGGLDHAWDFGDGTGATGPTATHVYGAPGTYRASLTVTDADGKAEAGYQYVTVLNRAPTASLPAIPDLDRLTTLSVPVAGTDLDGAVERLVARVDGALRLDVPAASGTLVVAGSQLTLGEHSATLVATDDSGAASPVASRAFRVVNRLPTATLSGPAGAVRAGVPASFAFTATDADSGGFSSTIEFGDGTPAIADPSGALAHAYARTGTFVARLTVTDADGGVSVATATVEVDATPPTTTATLPPTTTGWYAGDVEVALAVADNRPGATARYSVDSPVLVAYSGPFTVSGEGVHTVRHRGLDAVGNEEALRSLDVGIDETPPALDATGMPDDLSVLTGVVTLHGTASDALSGARETRILLDGAVVARGGASATFVFDTTFETLGVHDLVLESEDLAGNVASYAARVVVVNV